MLGKPCTRGGFHSEICFLYAFELYVIIRIENSNSIAAITRILTHTKGRGVFFQISKVGQCSSNRFVTKFNVKPSRPLNHTLFVCTTLILFY